MQRTCPKGLLSIIQQKLSEFRGYLLVIYTLQKQRMKYRQVAQLWRTHRRVISIIWGLSDTVGHTYVCRRRCKIFFAKQKTISKKTLYVLLADVVHLSTCAAEGAQCRLSRPRVGLFYVVTLHLPTFVLNGTCGSISNNCHFTCAAGIR